MKLVAHVLCYAVLCFGVCVCVCVCVLACAFVFVFKALIESKKYDALTVEDLVARKAMELFMTDCVASLYG